jgi:glycerol-3-phosphate cytidylyltransferase
MKIGFNCSCFDLFHAGHVTMLKMEKEMCDYLKVALQVDPTIDRPGLKNKPVESIYERYVRLQSCKYIDEILLYDTEAELLNLIKSQTMHIRFLSEEYRDRDFTGKQYCMDSGIEIHYHKRQHTYSTSDLRKRVYEMELKKKEEKNVIDIPQYSSFLIDREKIASER